jgi:hypothetical protein
MAHGRRLLLASLVIVLASWLASPCHARDDEPIPTSLQPFEYLIGAWKGVGIPAANRVKGWNERHVWAWAFEKGVPVALSVEMTGNKGLAKGRLSYDAAKKVYRLEGTDPDGKPVALTGTMDPAGRALNLEREGALADGSRQRWTLRLNSNRIRYVVWDERRAPGSPQYRRTIEMPMGKEGESFAAGATGGNAPKCIVTGGTATLSVSVEGRAIPVCCTGCRDEVLDNPQKYLKKLANRTAAEVEKGGIANAPARGDDDGAFDALLDRPKSEKSPSEGPGTSSPDDAPKAQRKGDAPKRNANK